MILEIRNIKDFSILQTKKIKNYKQYSKQCNNEIKKVMKQYKKDLKHNLSTELLLRIKKCSCLIKTNDYGVVVGIRHI